MGAWKTISPGTWNLSYGNCPNDPAGMTKAGLSLAPYPTFPRLALLAMQVFSIREKKRRLISDAPVVSKRPPSFAPLSPLCYNSLQDKEGAIMDQKQPIRGRFAPSPSGRMHLGNLFAALLAWLDVRSLGG